jgi:hypothetical protein
MNMDAKVLNKIPACQIWENGRYSTPWLSGIYSRVQSLAHCVEIKQCNTQYQTEYLKNHIFIFINAYKIFDKIQCPFVMRTLNRLRMEGSLLNMTASMKTYNNILIVKCWAFPLGPEKHKNVISYHFYLALYCTGKWN